YLTPGKRGGHQMCIDEEAGRIFLFGGWDGERDLADFWCYDLNRQQWDCISMDTQSDGGPDARSCHKICFDPKTRCLFTLGRYVDVDSRPNVNLEGDFWKYDTVNGFWTKISNNTQLDGGPELIYDHQMVVDSERGVMYVFGGSTIGPDPSQTMYSGLYAYDIATNVWRLLFSDATLAGADGDRGGAGGSSNGLRSRIGHSMLLNPLSRELYIFAGQRHKDYLSDMHVYDLDTGAAQEVSGDYSRQGGPEAGFTQRAALDADRGEFYVLSGLHRDRHATHDTVKSCLWCYSLRDGRWVRLYHNANTSQEYWARMADVEPRPRYAHQLVHCRERSALYLFGGNPGDAVDGSAARLDDFWEMTLIRPNPATILRRGLFQVRRQQFRELAEGGGNGAIGALAFLRGPVAAAVDHADPAESDEFRRLSSLLVFGGATDAAAAAARATALAPRRAAWGTEPVAVAGAEAAADVPTDSRLAGRQALYDNLLALFPLAMREPKDDL
ncbi:hypothetical protein HK405_012855, partial [Cladochytrium tenue]